MPCSVCAAPLFAVEQPLGLCRMHGLAGTTWHDGLAVLKLDGTVEVEPWYRRDALNTLRDLGSILPPLAARNSVRLVHHVLTPTDDELRAVVAEHQALTPAMRLVRSNMVTDATKSELARLREEFERRGAGNPGALTPFSTVTAPNAHATMDAHHGIRIVEQ